MDEEREVNVVYKDKKRVSFTMSGELYELYQQTCNKLGMKMSPRIELLVKKDLDSLNKLLKMEE